MSTTVRAKRCLLHEADIIVKTYDIDSAGHVSNIVYLRWMEDMRLALLEKHVPLENLIASGYCPVIASTQIEYKKAIKLFDKPRASMWIASITPATMQFEGEIRVNDELTTHATHTGAFINQQTCRPLRLPAAIVEKFKEAQNEC